MKTFTRIATELNLTKPEVIAAYKSGMSKLQKNKSLLIEFIRQNEIRRGQPSKAERELAKPRIGITIAELFEGSDDESFEDE